jgi:hypothetical protein
LSEHWHDGQRHDPTSLLAWFERMLRTLRECPEVGSGTCAAVDKPFAPGVLVHRCDDRGGSMVFLHNLSDRPTTVDLSELDAGADQPNQVFGNNGYPTRSTCRAWIWMGTDTGGSGCPAVRRSELRCSARAEG